MKNVYLASPFFNDKQLENLNKVLEELKKNDTIDNIFLPMDHQQSDLDFGSPLWKYTVFEQDVTNIDNADLVVAIVNFASIDDEILGDPGTLWEMGYAKGTNKPVILVDCETVDYDNTKLNLMIDLGSQVHLNISEVSDFDFNNIEISRKNYRAV